MSVAEKPIRLSQHASEQAERRGCTEKEIRETISLSPRKKAELGRLECQKDFAFNKIWNGKQYGIKQVRPIFIEGKAEIIVVTVYVYYS